LWKRSDLFFGQKVLHNLRRVIERVVVVQGLVVGDVRTSAGDAFAKFFEDFNVKCGIYRYSCWDKLLLNYSFGLLVVVSGRPFSLPSTLSSIFKGLIPDKNLGFCHAFILVRYSQHFHLKFPSQISRAWDKLWWRTVIRSTEALCFVTIHLHSALHNKWIDLSHHLKQTAGCCMSLLKLPTTFPYHQFSYPAREGAAPKLVWFHSGQTLYMWPRLI